MSAPSTSATTAVMNSLLGELTTLMQNKDKMLRGVREQVPSLIHELEDMKPAFEMLELVDELDGVVKEWRDRVRTMSRDAENRIHELMGDHGGVDAKAGFLKKTPSWCLNRLGKPHETAAQIMQLKDLVVKANEEPLKSKIDDCIHSSSRFVAADPGMPVMYKEATREELVSCLVDNEEKFKVVFILGRLGESTLAREVYDEIGGQFMYKAFVSVRQYDDTTSLLNALKLQLETDLNESSGAGEVTEEEPSSSRNIEENIARLVKEWLAHKRYLIVIDDLWLQSDWDIVSSTFAEDGNGSRVLVTTYKKDMALLACQNDRRYIHKLRTQEDKKYRNDVNDRYKQLPFHLRRSLLYLGMYAANHEVNRDDLVRQWIAEDFVSKLDGKDLEDVAKSYFIELVDRKLIEPKRTDNGEVLSCTIDLMMLDFIKERCEEHNFVYVAYYFRQIEERQEPKSFQVRRLSLQSSGADEQITEEDIANGLLLVRSLALFGESMSILLSCKYVRVLIVEIPLCYDDTDDIADLTVINQLLELRYLKVLAQKRVRLREIRGLVYLDCRHQLSDRPYISPLPRLSRLILPKHCRVLPEGIGNMKVLQTLHWFDVGNKTSADIEVLGELTSLKDLRISNHTMGTLATKDARALASSVGKLKELRYLHIDGWSEAKQDKLMNSLSLPHHLEVLNLGNCLITQVPIWIGGLHGLRRLNLRVWKISSDDVRVLGENLSSLVDLYLWAVCFAEAGTALVVGKESFKTLKHLELRSRDDVTARLRFEAGANSGLQELALRFDGQHWGGIAPEGMEHLPRLKRIRLHNFLVPSMRSGRPRNFTQSGLP